MQLISHGPVGVFALFTAPYTSLHHFAPLPHHKRPPSYLPLPTNFNPTKLGQIAVYANPVIVSIDTPGLYVKSTQSENMCNQLC